MLPKSRSLTATFSIIQTIKLWPLLCDKILWLFRSETFHEQNRVPLVGTLQAGFLPIQTDHRRIVHCRRSKSVVTCRRRRQWDSPTSAEPRSGTPITIRTANPCTFDPSTEDIVPALTLKSNLPNLCQVPLPSHGGTPVSARTLQR